MEFTGKLFKIKLEPEQYVFDGKTYNHILAHFYIDDDGNYIPKMIIDAFWLKDLLEVTKTAKTYLTQKESKKKKNARSV